MQYRERIGRAQLSNRAAKMRAFSLWWTFLRPVATDDVGGREMGLTRLPLWCSVFSSAVSRRGFRYDSAPPCPQSAAAPMPAVRTFCGSSCAQIRSAFGYVSRCGVRRSYGTGATCSRREMAMSVIFRLSRSCSSA